MQVKSTLAADPALIQMQLAAQNAKIAKTQSALDEALLRNDQVSRYQENTEADGEIVRQYQYSEDVRTSARSLVTNLQDRLREEKAAVIKLQRAAAAAPTSRTVLAVLENGIAVQITTDSDATAALADAMHPGDRVHIGGFGQISDGTLQVKLRSAAPTTNPTH